MSPSTQLNAALEYLNSSVTALHAVDSARALLDAAGFVQLDESDRWILEPGARYYIVRRGSALIAWIQGEVRGSQGIRMIGAHTDSPGLHLKPNAVYTTKGYVQVGVDVYGGPLLGTWTDRDLGLGGRALVKTAEGVVELKPIKIQKPILRIPQLAIHLNREVNTAGLILDKQKHLPPVLALSADGQEADNHLINKALADHLKVDPDTIQGWDLELIDVQPGQFGGLNDEFIFSGRIDNLVMCHAALAALLELTGENKDTALIALFDSEEIGSNTLNGAAAPFIRDTFSRIARFGDKRSDTLERTLARSFCISADGAHAIHPNYAEFHDAQHAIHLNRGPVIKTNANQRYATTGETAAVFRTLAKEVDVPIQNYVHRTDLPCGSTIGPITGTNLGLRVVDVGNPMLSMHSIRETAGTDDHDMMIKVLSHFLSRPSEGLF